MARPDIFEFDDPSIYLKIYFDFERQGNPELTVRRWALRMGLRSPKPLFALLQGTREYKLRDLEFIRKGMDLSIVEVRYFEALILWQRAPSAEKPLLKMLLDFMKEQHDAVLLKFEEVAESNVFESDDEELFSHWTDAALLSALRLRAVRSNMDLIRRNLLWERDAGQIERSMNKIKKHQLISDAGHDGPKPTYNKITTPNDKPHSGGRAYYAQVNQIATQAVALPYGVREFQCFSIPARMLDAPKFKHLLRKFREELAALSSEDGDTVFQFNLEMFPLLSPIGASSTEKANQSDMPLS